MLLLLLKQGMILHGAYTDHAISQDKTTAKIGFR